MMTGIGTVKNQPENLSSIDRRPTVMCHPKRHREVVGRHFRHCQPSRDGAGSQYRSGWIRPQAGPISRVDSRRAPTSTCTTVAYDPPGVSFALERFTLLVAGQDIDNCCGPHGDLPRSVTLPVQRRREGSSPPRVALALRDRLGLGGHGEEAAKAAGDTCRPNPAARASQQAARHTTDGAWSLPRASDSGGVHTERGSWNRYGQRDPIRPGRGHSRTAGHGSRTSLRPWGSPRK